MTYRAIVLVGTLVIAACGPKLSGAAIDRSNLDTLRVAVSSKSGEQLQKEVEAALLAAGVNGLSVVASAERAAIQGEADHQVSGWVSDDSQIAIGEQVGANLIVVAEELESSDIPIFTGKSRYAVRLSAVHPESGVLLGQAECDAKAEDVSLTCDYQCARKEAVRLVVERLLVPQG